MPSRTAPFISRLRLLRTAAALSPFSSSAPPRHSPRILRASPVGAPHPPRVSAAVSPLVLPVAAGFALFSMATAASSAASVHDFTVKVCTASCPPQNLDTPFPSGDLVPFQQRETEALYPYPIPLWGKVFAHRCLRDAATIRPFWDFLSQYLFGFSCRFFYPNLWRFSTCCYTAWIVILMFKGLCFLVFAGCKWQRCGPEHLQGESPPYRQCCISVVPIITNPSPPQCLRFNFVNLEIILECIMWFIFFMLKCSMNNETLEP